MSVALSPSERAVFLMIEAAAEVGGPFPANEPMAMMIGTSAASVSSYITCLQAKGWIAVEREVHNGPRRAKILASGKWTAFGAAGPSRTITARPSQHRPPVAPEPQSRDACFYCETRPEFAAEFGCRHCRGGAPVPHVAGENLFPRRSMVR